MSHHPSSLEPARERWEFDTPAMSDLPGQRAITARSIGGGESYHTAFAHVVTRMENDFDQRIVTQRANLLVNAPELLELADRLFNFYELHKSARGGALGQQYAELRAKIMMPEVSHG